MATRSLPKPKPTRVSESDDEKRLKWRTIPTIPPKERGSIPYDVLRKAIAEVAARRRTRTGKSRGRDA